MSEHDPRDRWRNLRAGMGVATVGLTLALSIAIGAGIGYLLDRRLGTNWLVIVFTLIGIVAGFKQLIQAVIRSNAEQEREERRERDERRRRNESGRD